MKKTNKLDFIFINQYVYQFQNRLQIYEKKNKNKTNKITESLFSTSWSLKKYYCFLFKKKIKKNNFFFKDINLLKENSIYSSNLLILEIENKYKKKIYNKFISKKISEYFLLKQLLLELKIKKYIRYVDDFAFFSNHSTELTQVRQSIETYLATLRLKIHPIKSQIFTTKQGANFLGFRIFPTHIRVRSNNLRIGKKRICLLNQAVNLGKISVSTANLSILSWFAHLAHGDTWQLRSHICFSVKHCKAVK
jgi:hypothetical protein